MTATKFLATTKSHSLWLAEVSFKMSARGQAILTALAFFDDARAPHCTFPKILFHRTVCSSAKKEAPKDFRYI